MVRRSSHRPFITELLMPRPPKTTSEAEERARQIIASTTDIEQLRIAQAVLLPLHGLTLEQTGQVLGRDSFWVSRTRNRFIRGEAIPATHGGRRNAYFNEQQEHELVRSALIQYDSMWGDERQHKTLRDVIREKLEKTIRRPVADSTITDMLDRETARYFPGVKWGNQRYVESALTRIAHVEEDQEYLRRRERQGGDAV